MNNEKYIVISNVKQAQFYLQHGVKPVDIVLTHRGDLGYKYIKEDTKYLYTLWKQSKNKNCI